MAVKTITITEEAYNVLKCLKKSDQSFSEIIIEVGDEKKGNINKFFGILKHKSKELGGMQEMVQQYRRDFNKDAKTRLEKLRKQYDNP
jgi:predicted CopG family antitoxin